MNSNDIGEQLKAASIAGDIDILYTVIQNDPYILERIDLIPFVETPLHISASMGHLQFSTEIMMLKPSFAWKLNQQGYSPIHLAMQNDQKKMVSRFVSLNNELVRVQGREGLTPLHYASQIGDVELLDNFLLSCPESIECLNVRFETALHVAVKNEKLEALQVLVGWLKTNDKRGAVKLEKKILNHKDEEGNTILHITALTTESKALQLLLKTRINLKEKNLQNKTALDMASNVEIKSILLNGGAKPGSKVTDAPNFAHKQLWTMINVKFSIYIRRIRRNMLEDQRNTWLIVATLVATATYQSTLSPPAGIYQVSASDNTMNITSSNSTISVLGNAGKSILSENDFYVFLFSNMISFLLSTIAIIILTPSGIISGLISASVASFIVCYLFSMWRVSSTHVNSMIVVIAFNLIGLPLWIGLINTVSVILQRIAKKLNKS